MPYMCKTNVYIYDVNLEGEIHFTDLSRLECQ